MSSPRDDWLRGKSHRDEYKEPKKKDRSLKEWIRTDYEI